MKTLLVAICVLISVSITVDGSAEIKFGVLAQRGPETALKEFGMLSDYLTTKMGEKVTIIPLKFTEFMDFVDQQTTGFILTNPWFFVRAKVMKSAQPVATINYKSTGNQMAGVIFARKDSGIKTMEDMRNKVIMCPKLSSPGGWLYSKGEMVKAGIVPEKDLKLVLETEKESHDEVVYAVRDGKADIGTVRNNILETLQKEGKIKLSEFAIINEIQHDNFNNLASTPLYPDWAIAALKDTPAETTTKMKRALLEIPSGHPVLEQARGIAKFEEPMDYASMEELLKLLKVAPFRSYKDK